MPEISADSANKISAPRAPSIFIGHGPPVYALWPNPFTPTWKDFIATVPTPRAILVISGHWCGPGLAVTAQQHPPTIHDFGNIGPEFFAIRYPAPGAPWLTDTIQQLLAPQPVEASTEWGLDHGAWTVLGHLWPAADVPVAQLRIDSTLTAADQIELGRRLAPLPDEGILLLGSGNIVHNLAAMRFDQLITDNGASTAAPWNERFDRYVADAVAQRDHARLAAWTEHPDADLAAPTPDHLLPALIVAGAALDDDELHTITTGPNMWSISMRSFAFA